MRLPALVDYQQAVQVPTAAFVDPVLSQGRPRLTPLGSPAVASGGFALTFDVTVKDSRFAVRCFHKQGNHLQERYAHIAEFVRKNSKLDFLIDVDYLPSGIRVNGAVFPIVRMPWVDGVPLSEWVEDHRDAPHALEKVRGQILDAVTKMRRAGTAHGDLQHGNILVDSSNKIRFVDYDGMFLPPLRHLGASEHGHRNYQHPGRSDSYDESLDSFAASVIDLSLNAVRHDRTLWDDFHTGENLLFSANDFTSPERSDVFSRLSRISAVAESARRLMDACAADFASVPAILSGTRSSNPPRQRAGAADRRHPNTPALVRAADRAGLLRHQGDEITVIGRVTGAVPKKGYERTTTFINFGDFRRGAFTIVAFDLASRELQSEFGEDLRDLQHSWVSLTGLLTLYQSRWSSNVTPQIELRRVRSLRVLDAPQADVLSAQARAASTGANGLGRPTDTARRSDNRPPSTIQQPSSTPQARARRSDQSTPAPKVDDIEQRLGKLYSSPKFTRGVSQPATTSGATPSPPPPLAAKAHAHPPAPPQHNRPSRPQQPPSWSPTGSRQGSTPPPQGQFPQTPQPTAPAQTPQPTRPSWWKRVRRRLGL